MVQYYQNARNTNQKRRRREMTMPTNYCIQTTPISKIKQRSMTDPTGFPNATKHADQTVQMHST